MLYIVSGASRSGKSLVAKRFLKEQSIAYFPIDSLVMGLTQGAPELGISDTLWPDTIAQKLRPVLDALIANLVSQGIDYLLEGEAVFPAQLHQLQLKHPNQIKGCFMGYAQAECQAKVDAILQHPSCAEDWLAAKPLPRIQRHVHNMIGYSDQLRQQCDQYGLPYFDSSEDFLGTIDRVMDYLIKEERPPKRMD